MKKNKVAIVTSGYFPVPATKGGAEKDRKCDIGNQGNFGESILIEAMHGMGDVVCMIPLMKQVREAYPHSYITVVVNRNVAVDIVELSGLNIDEIIAIDAHGNKAEFLKLCLKQRKRKPDVSISSVETPVNKAKLMMGIINARKKVGIQFTAKKNYMTLNDQYHFVDANLLMLEQLGIANRHYKPELIPREDDVERFRKLFEDDNNPIIGVCIGRADISYKNKRTRTDPVYTRGWGNFNEHAENMRLLISGLLEKNYRVSLIGGKNEMDIHDAISEEIRKGCIDFVGKTTVAESIALASVCDVVIGVDTGMQHIADASGTKTVSLFGPTNPRTHGAYSNKALFAEVDMPCRFCFGTCRYGNCEDRQCMKKIKPSQVLDLIEESLKREDKNEQFKQHSV